MELNKYIDYTNLKSTTTVDEIEMLCKDALNFQFATVCVHPYYVSSVSQYLKGTSVGICTVVGFPLGQNTTASKVYEAIDAVENGADEIDMVINIAALKNNDYDYIKNEIEEVRDAISGKILKIIIETCALTDAEIVKMTEICRETFVNFIKTSTGFDKAGATLHAVELMAKYKGDTLEIKAAGGIRTKEEAMQFIEAGATRLGSSSAVKIMEEQ